MSFQTSRRPAEPGIKIVFEQLCSPLREIGWFKPMGLAMAKGKKTTKANGKETYTFGTDLIPRTVAAIRPVWKQPDNVAEPPAPEYKKAAITILGRTSIMTAYALWTYVRIVTNHCRIEERTIERSAVEALYYVLQERLMYQPAVEFDEIKTRLEFLAEAEGEGIWPDNDKCASLLQAKRDITLLSDGTIEHMAGHELESWYARDEAFQHGFAEAGQ